MAKVESNDEPDFMTLLPMIARELRAESRGAFTYWLRVSSALTLIGVGLLFFLEREAQNWDGKELFFLLHRSVFIMAWVVGTVLTADVISRERRDGTLGILFLTPLRPLEVVTAKGVAHGLRALGVGVAALPVMVLPFLI